MNQQTKRTLTAKVGAIAYHVVVLTLSAAIGVGVSACWKRFGWRSHEQSDQGRNRPVPLEVGGVLTEYSVTHLASRVKTRGTLLIATDPDCAFCRRSERFHREVVDLARAHSWQIRLITSSASLSDSLGVRRAEMVTPKRFSHEIEGTPTIAVLSQDGSVTHLLTGELPTQEEHSLRQIIRDESAEVEQRARTAPISKTALTIGESGKRQPTITIDVGPRLSSSSPAGRLVIPLEELFLRAKFELDSTEEYVVDCARVDESGCRRAVSILNDHGISTQFVNTGHVFRSCNRSPMKGFSEW